MIRLAQYPTDNKAVVAIWWEYIGQTQANLDFQQNDKEFAKFPMGYEPPSGCVLLAECEGKIGGCAAMRRYDASICEMKRLYVRPYARGKGIGGQLIKNLIDHARSYGYSEIRLDVLEEFDHSRRLYREFGFAPSQPIVENPIHGTAFLGLTIA